MHVLVATHRTQGQRQDDFSWALEGELVRLPGLTYDCPDCGCDRSFAGLGSSRATTTAMVIDNPNIDAAAFCDAFAGTLSREGWLTEAEDARWVDDWAVDHLRVAASYPPGTVLELRGDRLRPRSVSDQRR